MPAQGQSITEAIRENISVTGIESAAPLPDMQTQGDGLKNPRELYPKPPFEKQPQPWPGLACKMTPLPDHGEKSYRGSGRLKGRKALLTGGDSGIGRAAAIAFAREGADVAINYLPQEEEDAREVVALIEDAGGKAAPIPGDIRDEMFCKRLVDDAVNELGGLDILVNNAARQHVRESITEITTEDLDWTFRTNLYALFWITKAAVPHMRPGSTIINTTSINAYEPSQHLLDYAVTKAGILNFTWGLAKQLAKQGIRVNAVAPGPFWTPLQPSGGQTQEHLTQFGGDTPLGRPGQPAEIAPLYVLLASAESSYATGQVFGATGGEVGP
ncbi:SDR family oxidoreductase [Methylocystis iwaonis]|uniref:Oxidoreductase n=1 Tax=Methylocystis iwaonis TaxID=2885079 RepID=A0ABM8EB84_9HYPH|nr:oxidoreductase [Methylocystis iwaonis]